MRRIFVFVILVTAGFLGGLVLTGRLRTAGESAAQATSAPPPSAGQAVRTPLPTAGGLPDLTSIADRAVNGVTNISSTQTVRRQTSPFANDPFFQFFFGDDPFSYRERREQSLGSGVLVSADGYVLTNNHVVSGGNERAVVNEVTVMLSDKRELKARVVGTDVMTDIAVLKVSGTNLPALTWGDSSKLRVAEWVLAIGNPYQLNQTVTLGIVSATGRRLGGSLASYEDFIQTDAAINPGNSGGALINARGELVGINTAIYSQSGGYQGIGFAVPSNLARHVMDDIIKYGAVRRGTITGIQLQPMTPQIAQQLGAPNDRGVLVVNVDPRADAYDQGLRRGDVIVTFNGTAIDDASHFIRLLSDSAIGTTATLGILSNGRERTIKVPVVPASGARTRV
ncbi:MAG TPA: trypsin-like peptidase domain-containing protein [Vicinamibacterales bacterium]|nr:trypsin-like peptidase domain-containing protein [Vicinamibacterales bacterium]